MHPELIWSPVADHLFAAIREGDVSILISPFIKRDAFEQVLGCCRDPKRLQVVANWSARALLSGATDSEIFPLIERAGGRLYVHPEIHLKLYILSRNRAFHTSSNITLRGLGLASTSNIEIGCEVKLGTTDWHAIYRILNDSVRVDQRMYEVASTFVAHNRRVYPETPPLELAPSVSQTFSLAAFPLCITPELFLDLHGRLRSGASEMDDDVIYAVAHDQSLFGISDDMNREQALHQLRVAFRAQPFVGAIVRLLKAERSARFGLVTDWIQQNCADKPLPYRREIKDTVRILYDWLEFFYDEVRWNVPGAHSMVIHWEDRK